jgi:hypothetical protein
MNQRFAYLMVAGFAFAAGPHALMSASPVEHPGGDVEILVDGAHLQRYAHGGRWYIEALKGREYAIRLRNPYAVRVAVALSIDGLNTIDARQTTAAAARKWVLDPYETVTISGWQTSKTEARRFEFTTETRSYAQALGKTANLGVISAVFFKERVFTTSKDYVAGGQAAAPQSSESIEQQASAAADRKETAADKYAATGMGRRTNHAVTQISLDLEHTPAHTVNIRYEFHPQLVRLGVLPPAPAADPLQRRERAHGFEPDFCPEPLHQR